MCEKKNGNVYWVNKFLLLINPESGELIEG